MWKDAFLAADTPQKGDDSHRIVFWMHSFIKYLYLGCMVLTYNVTWSPEPSVNCHFLEMFTHVKTAKLPIYCLAWYQFKWLHIPVADPGEGPRGAAPDPLFLDQTEAWRAEKVFFETGPSFSSPPPYLKVKIHHCIPHVFQTWLWKFSQGAKPMTSREI